jgi:hypothetical protein
MAVAQAYGKTVTTGSVFAYDVADTRNSFRGQPTTNIYSTDGFSFWQVDGNHTATRYTGNAPDLTVITNNYDYHTIVATGNWSNEANRALLWTNSGLLQLNTQYAVSFYARVTSTSTANIGAAFYGNALPNSLTLTNEWQRFTVLTSTTATYRPFEFGSKSGAITFQIAGLQYEAKSHSTPYINGTRSVTQGLLPLVGNSTLDLSYVSFDSNAQMVFDGTNDYIDAPYYSEVDNNLSRTWEVVVKPTTPMSFAGIFGQKIGYGCSYHCNGGIYLWDSNWVFDWFDNSSYQFLYSGVSPTPNQYFHIVATFDASDRIPRIYVNGQLQATWGGVTNMNYGDSTNIIDIGWNSKDGGQHYFGGEIPVTRHYSGKALSAEEVKQNFDFYDARFGIDIDTYYFVVSNRAARYKRFTGTGKNMATSTPAYIIYQKPDASNTGPSNYTEVARDDIGTPTRTTIYGNQLSYSNGRYLTTVIVRKSKRGGRLSFEFPDGGTSQYGEEFYKTIITPYVP